MATVNIIGEINYDNFERGVRMMFTQMTPEQRLKYASKISGSTADQDLGDKDKQS